MLKDNYSITSYNKQMENIMRIVEKKHYLSITITLVLSFIFYNQALANEILVNLSEETILFDKEKYSTNDRIEVKIGRTYSVKVMDSNLFLFDYEVESRLVFTKEYLSFKNNFKNEFSKYSDTAKNLGGSFKLSSIDSEITTAIDEAYKYKRKEFIDTSIDGGKTFSEAKKNVTDWDIDEWMKFAINNPDSPERKKQVEKLYIFQKMFLQIGNEHLLEKKVFLNDSRKELQYDIITKENNSFDDILSDNAKTFRNENSGKITITFSPKTYTTIRITAGGAYSFIEDTEFAATELGSAGKVVSESSNDYKGLIAASTINVSPSFLHMNNFEPYLQVGAGWDGKDAAGLLGVGFSFYSYPEEDGRIVSSLTLSGGVIGQEVDKLIDGWNVGDNLTQTHVNENSTSIQQVQYELEDVVERKWDTGFYLMLGAQF